MYSYIFSLITFCQLLVYYPYLSSGNECESTGYIITPGIGAHNFYYKTSKTWNDARDTCIRDGAHLVIIESEAEEKLIAKFETEHKVASMWVGFHQQFAGSDWVSVLDQPIDAVGYKHWRDGEPNNINGEEHCAAYDTSGLNDLNCSLKREFICKIDLF